MVALTGPGRSAGKGPVLFPNRVLGIGKQSSHSDCQEVEDTPSG